MSASSLDGGGVMHHHAPRSSVFESFSTTCKCIIGSGIMSLPYAFAQSGWIVGIFFLLIVALLSYSTMSLIIAAVHLTRARLRRRKQATSAHARRTRVAQQKALEGGDAGDESGDEPNTETKEYGTFDAESRSLSSTPFGSPSVSDRAVDPLDLSVIEQDPDLDVIGYQQVAYVAYGEWGRISTDTVLIFTQVGSCAAFLVLVLTNIQACLASYGIEWSLYAIALPLAPIVIALSLPRSTTHLAPAAHFGNLTLLIGIGTIVYFGVTSPTSDLAQVHKKGLAYMWHVITELPVYSGNPFGILVFFGISSFAFAAHCEVVAVEADAQSRKVYQVVLPSSLVFIACLYTLVAVFAFACFGEDTKSNIMLNLGDTLFVNLVRIVLSCTLLVNFSLALFPASQTLDLLIAGPAPVSRDLPHQHEFSPKTGRRTITEQSGLLVNDIESDAQVVSSPPASLWPPPVLSDSPESPIPREHEVALTAYHRKGNLIRIVTVVSTFAIGLAIQDLGVLFSLVGSVAGGILCFTMPPLFWYRVSELERHKIPIWIKLSLLAQTIFGLTLVAMGIIVVILDAAEESRGHK